MTDRSEGSQGSEDEETRSAAANGYEVTEGAATVTEQFRALTRKATERVMGAKQAAERTLRAADLDS